MTASIHISSTRTSTLSVLVDLLSVYAFAYNGRHAEALSHRKDWFSMLYWPAYVVWPMLSGGSVMTMSLRGRKPGKGSNTSMTMVRRHMRSIPVRPSTTVRQCSCAEISSKTGRSRSSAKITQIISPMLRKIRP